MLTEREVTSTGIENQIHPSTSQAGPGTIRDPGVLADFKSETDATDIENQIADRQRNPTAFYFFNTAFRPRLEPARFVVQSIPGEILLRDKSGHITINNKGYRIVD